MCTVNLLNLWQYRYDGKFWFRFNKETYHKILQLIDDLRRMGIKPPYYARYSWEHLPQMMKTIEKEKNVRFNH